MGGVDWVMTLLGVVFLVAAPVAVVRLFDWFAGD